MAVKRTSILIKCYVRIRGLNVKVENQIIPQAKLGSLDGKCYSNVIFM